MADQRRIFAITNEDGRPLGFAASETLATDSLRTAEPDEELHVESHTRPDDAEGTVWAVLGDDGRVIRLRGQEADAREDRDEYESDGEQAWVMPYTVLDDTAPPAAAAQA